MRILFLADLHLHYPKKVPQAWQYARYMMLADEINKTECDLVILGGDTLDSAKPTPAETELFYDFISKIEHEGLIYSGNHEMQSKHHSILWNYKSEIERTSKFNVVKSGKYFGLFDIVDYPDIQKESFDVKSSVCFTHVRGAIEPHVKPETDLTKFSKWDYVFAGDLHSYSNSQLNILYPGSPVTTSMHRVRALENNGMYLITIHDSNPQVVDHEWIDLSQLPQLLKKTVETKEEIVPTEYDFTMYELKGSVDDLAKVGKLDLLDKKVNIVEVKEATMDFSKLESLSGEMYEYLTNVVKASNVDSLIRRFNKYARTRETRV